MKICIYGASGYTGQELLRLLVLHPEAEVVSVTSRRYKGVEVSEVYPVFTGITNLRFSDARPDEAAAGCDFIFSALPHGIAMGIVPELLESGKKVVDLSADFRLRDVAVYEKHYRSHVSAELVAKAVYGLPELYRKEIRKAKLAANPGCYPTSVILGLAPALKGGLIDPGSIIVDSKSGVSGAGREPKVGSLFCEVGEAFKPYSVLKHRHAPEMEQELSALAGRDVRISFVPHLLPVNRGILSTIYAGLAKKVNAGDVLEAYSSFYRKEKFVRVYKQGFFPNISSVKGTNNCDIGVAVDEELQRLVIVSAIDNLVKGAAGQAIQNMNLMCGFNEAAGLQSVALFP